MREAQAQAFGARSDFLLRATLATNEEDFPSSILISTEPTVGSGTYEGTVDVTTDDPIQSVITVPVRVIVAGGQQ
jgi:hypothetical protein